MTRAGFFGVHRRKFMGYPPSGRRVGWAGCGLFTFDEDLIADLWVLGDLEELEGQLQGDER
ncbi:MAG: ester cyclase [Vicinamibacterales bacterium]|nr:ester cyclase [Vicinamibacterales bacterium]MDP7471622.1 ester cyclase [Vicinamibacterales bacterium]MDP7672503.1 ester cyclase [Vicinamibacterales bacterium]HJO37074.1 ester cyclase [Vicinamibacterales bacterium]